MQMYEPLIKTDVNCISPRDARREGESGRSTGLCISPTAAVKFNIAEEKIRTPRVQNGSPRSHLVCIYIKTRFYTRRCIYRLYQVRDERILPMRGYIDSRSS
ncbi:uncharacterized protein LOC143903741 [Temnothorax americanus]|uniref:uncharacterized protein LOC143903741 n=1 Tax=Temnothorax americanus TaxID=1964332 RepID=UPI0040697BB5